MGVTQLEPDGKTDGDPFVYGKFPAISGSTDGNSKAGSTFCGRSSKSF